MLSSFTVENFKSYRHGTLPLEPAADHPHRRQWLWQEQPD